MAYDPEIHHRRSIRLRGYDYSQPGSYFVTVCTHDKRSLLGHVVGNEVKLSAFGEIVVQCWRDLPQHYPQVRLDSYVVMPNHIHGIIVMGAGAARETHPYSLAEIVRGFKTWSARRANQMRMARGRPLWQRGYYEHIIRNEDEWGKIREYIATNPLCWESDRENPDAGLVSAM